MRIAALVLFFSFSVFWAGQGLAQATGSDAAASPTSSATTTPTPAGESLLKSTAPAPKATHEKRLQVQTDESITRRAEGMPYLKSTTKNLAHAYFVLGVLDVNKNEDIDDYLIITSCDLYLQYFKDEIEWQNVRDSARKFLKTNKNKFSTRFEHIMPIYLDRYNTEKKHFEIIQYYRMLNSTEVRMSNNPEQERVCNGNVMLSGFPYNVILNPGVPASLTVVPVDLERARSYMQEMESLHGPLAGDNPRDRIQRPAYVRFRGTFRNFSKFKQISELASSEVTVNGRLDSIEVFAEPELVNLLYKKEFGVRRLSEKDIMRQLADEAPLVVPTPAPQGQQVP